MNIAYIRKSQKSVDEVKNALNAGLEKLGINVVGESPLGPEGVLIHIYDAKRTPKVLDADQALVGLVPSVIIVKKAEGKTAVGLMNPQLLMGSPAANALEDMVHRLDHDLRELVNGAAGVGSPKVQKIKLFSTATCPYCKMEKDYLEKHKIPFELVMVDADRKAAEEMMRKSGQMGVPQTEVVFDDGDSEIVIGFDKGRLNEFLGIKA